MGSESTNIFIKDFHVSNIAEIENFLTVATDSFERIGNKVPSWEGNIDHHAFILELKPTEKLLHYGDHDDDLLEFNLLPEDVPFTFNILICHRGLKARACIQKLADGIIDIFGGYQTEIIS